MLKSWKVVVDRLGFRFRIYLIEVLNHKGKFMSKQNFEIKNDKIREQFEGLKKSDSEKLSKRLNLSWSNWGFGMESLLINWYNRQHIISGKEKKF